MFNSKKANALIIGVISLFVCSIVKVDGESIKDLIIAYIAIQGSVDGVKILKGQK